MVSGVLKSWFFQFDKGQTNQTSFTSGDFKFNNAADFGNFNAGYTGAHAGVSRSTQYKWAGMGEVIKFHNNTGERISQIYNGIAPYGDQARDFMMNTKGMNVADEQIRGAPKRPNIKGTSTGKVLRYGPNN